MKQPIEERLDELEMRIQNLNEIVNNIHEDVVEMKLSKDSRVEQLYYELKERLEKEIGDKNGEKDNK